MNPYLCILCFVASPAIAYDATLSQFIWHLDNGIAVIDSEKVSISPISQCYPQNIGYPVISCGVLLLTGKNMRPGKVIYKLPYASAITFPAGVVRFLDNINELNTGVSPDGGLLCIGSYVDEKSPAGENMRYVKFGGVCSSAPVPPTPSKITCSIEGNNAISYGEVSTDNILGLKKDITLNLLCDGDATVLFTIGDTSGATNKIYLRKDDSIFTQITDNSFDSTKEKVSYTVKANASQSINIESTLGYTDKVSTGDFNGNTVAVVSIP